MLRTLAVLLLCAVAQAFVVTSAPLHRPAVTSSTLAHVSMQESLEKVSKATLAGTVVGVSLVGVAALTSAQGSPPGGLAFGFLAFVVMKLAADAGGLD